MSKIKQAFDISQGPQTIPSTSHTKTQRRLHRLRRLIRRSDGGAMVEMALTLPILLCVLTGIFWFCIALFQKLELAEAVSVAGRSLAVERGFNDPCSASATKLYAAAPGLSSSSLSLTFTLNGVATSGSSCPGSGGAANPNMISGGTAVIDATYPCTLSFFPAFGTTFSNACSLHSKVTELVQ